VGGRTRAAFEREKMLVLRSIKEAEFDRAMRKISDADFHEVATRLRSRAAGLIRQLEGDASGYRALIERDLAVRVGAAPVRVASSPQSPSAATAEAATPPGQCPRCHMANDADARFCKSCGARLEGVA
jgi:rRNA maturation endonuclease Nob1